MNKTLKFITNCQLLFAVFTNSFGQNDTRTDNHVTVVIPNIAIGLRGNCQILRPPLGVPGMVPADRRQNRCASK
jgi:hypothetical protein